MRDWRATPLEWLSSTHALDLDLGRVTRHTVVHQSLTSVYIPNAVEIGKTFFLDRLSAVPLQVQGHVTKKTRTNIKNPAGTNLDNYGAIV